MKPTTPMPTPEPTTVWPFPTHPIYRDNVPPPTWEKPEKKIFQEPFTVSQQSDKVGAHRRDK